MSRAFLATIAILTPTCCYSQQVIEGGMRFAKRDNDLIRMSSGASTGLQLGGSAAVSGGGINVGSAGSDVTVELNPMSADRAGRKAVDLSVAGNPREWAKTLDLQRTTPSSSKELIDRRVSSGSIDAPENSQLRNLLQSGPQWVETIAKENLKDQSKPFVSVQFTEDYERLSALLGQRDPTTGKPVYRGTSVYSMTGPTRAVTSPSPNQAKPNEQFLAWRPASQSSTGEEVIARALFKPHERSSNKNNSAINIANLQSSGSSSVFSRFTILGFNKNPDPLAGKTSHLSAFAANTKTIGSLRVTREADGSIPTLESISRQFGVTVKQLMQANGISDPEQDIEGLTLTVPADFSTVEAIKLSTSTTLAELAKVYGISINWLMDLNGISNPNESLAQGTTIYVPGQRPANTISLKANTTPAELADLYGVSVSVLLSLNGLTDSQQALKAGDSFILPSPRALGAIVLDKSESPAEIALRFGVSPATLLELNGFSNLDQKLAIGTRVEIPGPTLLPEAKPAASNLEYVDYGAYTTYTVTYHLEGSLVPLFSPTLFNTLR